MAKNKNAVNTGVGKAYYSIIDKETGAFGEVKELNDIVSFSINPNESTSSFYAGDRKLIVDSTINITGSIVVPAITSEQLVELFGYVKNAKGEVLYSSNTANRNNVALIIEQNLYGETDYIYLWDVKLTLPTNEGSTKNDSISYGTRELSFEVLVPEDSVYMTIANSKEDGFVAPDFTAPLTKATV